MTTTKAKEVEKLQKNAEEFEKQVKDLTLDRMNQAPREETEPQTKLSSQQIADSKKIWLKPERKIPDGQKFNSKYESDWNYDKEYVQFIAEHKEIIGETIDIWTHPYGGVGAEYWRVPTNKPVWGPRYLAEQIRKCSYHRLRMDQNIQTPNQFGSFFGGMIVDITVPRLTAEPVSTGRSIFMGAAA